MSINLTEHFTLDELLASQTAVEQHITEQFEPGDAVVQNLRQLCARVLEPLRAKITAQKGADTPLGISSGYRCYRLNQAVGGAGNSQHLFGQAADTHVVGMSVEQWYQFVKTSGIEFDQLIQEFNEWVHISFMPAGPQRHQCLRAIKENGTTKYLPD